jgi:hypothetical protein
MAYFSNGSEGAAFYAQNCERCVHEPNCTVWLLHLMRNYDECNKPDSMLHVLIPRTEDGWNGDCTMFHAKADQATATPGDDAKRPTT